MGEYIRKVLSEEYAREICGWKYEGAYSVYNFFDWNKLVENDWNFAIKEKREAEFIAILSGEELIAFGRVSENSGKAFLGVGLKPSW
jgi:[ribosomal protein S18]-alanine N-acetyltransferase